MAQYPVSDAQGMQEGLNYVLSGPNGTGQFFNGISEFQSASLSGNYRPPFINNGGYLTVAPISLATSEYLGPQTWKFTFASAQAAPPFQLGNNVTVDGTSISFYNDYWGPIGVTECTTTYCVVQTAGSYSDPGPATGGEIYSILDTNNALADEGWTSTDCNAKVNVTGAQDRVFIAAQINNNFTFSKAYTGVYSYTAAINRYKAFSNNDPTNPEYLFDFDKTISQQEYSYSLDATVNQAATFTVTSGVPATRQLQRTYFVPNVPTTSGTGNGVNLNITIAAGATLAYTTTGANPNTIIEIAGEDGGENYTVGDVITIDGADLGGTSGVNDLVLTVATTSSFADTQQQETIFGTVIDEPDPGYYWYILELKWFSTTPDDLTVGQSTLGFRNLTVQVVKP
jgi:hypothetical protein